MWPVPSGCIGIHAVKIYQARSRQFSGDLLPFLPVCCRDRAERVLAVRVMRRYGKSGLLSVDLSLSQPS